MNTTSYLPERDTAFRAHLRPNSLETLHKIKHKSSHEQQEPFRKSLTSFDKVTKTHRNELPQIRYEKQMDNNIYFNPHSRNNFFKNLIDSYFDKQQNAQNPLKVQQKSARPTHILRRSVLSKKNPIKDVEFALQKQNIHPKLIQSSNQHNNNKQSHTHYPSKASSNQHQSLLRPKSHLQKMSSQQQKQTDPIMDYMESGAITLKPHSMQSFNEQSFLRKITQAMDDEDFDEQTQLNSRQQLLNTTFTRTQSNFSRLEDNKVLTYENAIIKLFTSHQNQKKYRIKQFKNPIFLKRHSRSFQCGAYTFWKPYKFNQMSLIIPYLFPLKDYLFKLLPHPTSPDYSIVQPKQFYYRMTANHCQELFLLFREFVKDLHKVSPKVLNNKINLSNLFYINGKLCLGEWEYSAFKESNQIQGNHFESRVEPILKCDNDWLVSPEYLAPEILESLEDPRKPFDLWQYENASDIYSIGLTFLQIITLIPMWMQQRASVKSKIMKPRDGLLSTGSRSAVRILEKQKLLVSRMTILLEREVGEDEKNWPFFKILLRMIEPIRSKRISMQQLLKQIE